MANTPGPSMRMLMRFSTPPHAGLESAHASLPNAHVSTPHTGGNPFARAVGGNDQEGHLLPPLGRPGTVSGIIGRMLDKADINEYNAKVDQTKDASQQKQQAAIDSFMKQMQSSGGNPDAALMAAVHPDNEGHVHFMDPDSLKAMTQIYQITKAAQGGMQAPTDFGVHDIGNGYSVATGPGMHPTVLRPAGKGKPQYIQTAQGLMTPDPSDPTKLTPVTSGGETVQPKANAVSQRYLMSLDDERYMGAASGVLKAIDLLKDAGKDAQGFIRGPAGQFFSRLMGTNNPQMIWGAAKSGLEQALIEGKVPGAYAGPLKEYLKGLPQSWHAAPYDATGLNVMGNRLRSEYTQRANFVEAHNGGRAIPNQQDLQAVGVYPQSLGWQNPRALLAAGTPEALRQISLSDATFLSQHLNELTPQEQQNWQMLKQMRTTQPTGNNAPPPQLMPAQAPGTPAQPSTPEQLHAQQPVAPPPNPAEPQATAPIPPEPQATAPISPAAPPQQNPIMGALMPSAQAAEPPVAAVPSADQQAATSAMAGPGPEELDRQAQASALIRQAHDLLMQSGPSEPTEKSNE